MHAKFHGYPAHQLAVPRASQQTPGSGVGAWGTAARQRLGSGTIEAGGHAARRAGERRLLPSKAIHGLLYPYYVEGLGKATEVRSERCGLRAHHDGMKLEGETC